MDLTSRSGGVTCVLASLDLGGVPRVYLSLLGHLSAGGMRCRVVAPDGPLRIDFEAGGVDWQPVEWDASRLSTYQRVAQLLEPDGAALIVADPRTAHVLPALVSQQPTILAVHSAPPRFERWFEAGALERLRRLVHDLATAGKLRVVTIGETYAEAYGGLFALDPSEIVCLPPAVSAPPRAVSISERLDSVLVVARMSPEKEPLVRAGIELVATRLAHGRACLLDLIGDGPWRSDAEAACDAALPPGSWRFHGPTHDPLPAMATAGVVVATGITALEAASVAARVVIARTAIDDLGALGPVLALATYDAVARDSFGARTMPPVPAEEVWTTLEALTPRERDEIRKRVERQNSVEAAAKVLATALAPAAPPTVDPTALAVGELASDMYDRLLEVQRVADELWVRKLELERQLQSAQAPNGT